jgi:hypothetical protein
MNFLHFSSVRARATLSAVALLCCVAFSQASAQDSSSVSIADGIVYSASNQQLFSADGAGDLQAHDAKTGALLWRSSVRALPLYISADALIALAPADARDAPAQLRLINMTDGKVVASTPMEFPTDVFADWRASPAQQFIAYWRTGNTADAGQLIWEYSARPVRGALLEDESSNAVKQARGAFNISVKKDGFQISAASERAVNDFKPFRADYAPSEQTDALPAPQFRGANSLSVMLSRAQNDAIFGTSYEWQLYSREGARLGGLSKIPVSYAPHLLQQSQLLVQLPPYAFVDARGRGIGHARRLAAFDITNQQELWSFDVYDVQFRGPFPP